MNFPTVSELYFEAHVTIDPVFGFDRDKAEDIARQHNFKLAKLVMLKGNISEESKRDTFMTSHDKLFLPIKERTIACVKQLKAAGFVVRRYKIEDTILDSRTNDIFGVLK